MLTFSLFRSNKCQGALKINRVEDKQKVRAASKYSWRPQSARRLSVDHFGHGQWQFVTGIMSHRYFIDDLIYVLHYVTLWRHAVAWRHRSSVIRFSIDDILQCSIYVFNRNQACMSLSFHDVISDVITPVSTIRMDPIDTHDRRPLKDSSHSDKNARRRSISKAMTSQLWRHRVTWRHR